MKSAQAKPARGLLRRGIRLEASKLLLGARREGAVRTGWRRGPILCALAAHGLCDGSRPAEYVATGNDGDDVATLMGYFRAESSLGSKASRMLEEE
jgi:hypothetical protein